MITALAKMIRDVLSYWRALWYYWVLGGSFSNCSIFADSPHAHVHVFSVALDVLIWSKPHYRKPSYQQDLADNLRNVAIPGTGIALSHLAQFKVVAAFFYVFICPVLCVFAAVNDVRVAGRLTPSAVAAAFHEHLLEPQNWYNYWRINSRLAAWHGYVTEAKDYESENKWTFLKWGDERGVAVTPFLKEPRIVCKHKNEEGGLGIEFFDNAACGGDWIIQTVLHNNDFISSLLPENAPLSTFRVLTASWGGIDGRTGVKVLSCVFRAGRANKKTDHSSVLFNVDTSTGCIGKGMANSHWYKLGLDKIFSCPWTAPNEFTKHPDNGLVLTGVKIPDFANMLKTCVEAHEKVCPQCPLAGWDLTLTKEHGPCLLETNLSCNFFKGSFDQAWYFDFIRQYYQFCEGKERSMNNGRSKKTN